MAKVVTFTRMCAPYRGGDVAKLDDATADKVIARGYATRGDATEKQAGEKPVQKPNGAA